MKPDKVTLDWVLERILFICSKDLKNEILLDNMIRNILIAQEDLQEVYAGYDFTKQTHLTDLIEELDLVYNYKEEGLICNEVTIVSHFHAQIFKVQEEKQLAVLEPPTFEVSYSDIVRYCVNTIPLVNKLFSQHIKCLSPPSYFVEGSTTLANIDIVVKQLFVGWSATFTTNLTGEKDLIGFSMYIYNQINQESSLGEKILPKSNLEDYFLSVDII